MYRLLLLLWSAAPLLGCDTGVAFPGQSLSLYRSSLANADVALLKSYDAADVNGCLHDCCTEKYGSCSVASFKKNATGSNCQLFNCRPVQKCKFVSSTSTDSFSFSSSTLPRVSVPSSSRHASSGNNSSSSSSSSTTTTTTSSSPTEVVDEQFASKSDNTTVKPRKGVVDGLKDIFGNEERSGSKPRKGVGLERGESAKSKVKPRKGVGPQPDAASSVTDNDTSVDPTPSERNESTPKVYQDAVADDLTSALEKVFQDDARDRPLVTSSKEFLVDNPPQTSVTAIRPSSSVDSRDVIPTSLTTLLQPSSAETTTPGLLLPSLTTSQLLSTSQVAASTVRTPHLLTGPVRATGVFGHTPTPSSPTILEHSRLIFHESAGKSDSGESESEKKYNASMHLVLSLVFGLLILVSVLGVVAKRVYDSWMRRHYRRMDFLIDGMYNGYG